MEDVLGAAKDEGAKVLIGSHRGTAPHAALLRHVKDGHVKDGHVKDAA